MNGMSGPVSPASSSSRQQGYGRAAARDRARRQSSQLGTDGAGKIFEDANPIALKYAATWWLWIIGGIYVSAGIYDYTFEAYENPLDRLRGNPALTGLTGAKARNVVELQNNSTLQSGYLLSVGSTTCAATTGIIPVSNLLVPCVGYEAMPGTDPVEYRFLFWARNDPLLYGVPG